MSMDPDVPVIIVATLGLLLLAGFSSIVIAFFFRPIERRVHRAADELRKVENGDKDANTGSALAIVGGIALLMLTLVGVLTVAKGLGLGAMGKGVGILAFTGVAAAIWGFVAMLRRGHGKWLFAGLGAAGAIAGTVFGLWDSGAQDTPLKTVAELRMEVEEVGREITREFTPAAGDVGVDLFAMASNTIPLDSEPSNTITESEAEVETTAAETTPPQPEIKIGESAEPLPDWAEDGRASIISDLFFTESRAREDALRRIGGPVLEEYNTRGLGGLSELPEGVRAQELWERFVTEEFVEKRTVSLEDAYIVHALVEIDDEGLAWFSAIADEYVAGQQRQRGLLAVSASGGGVLLALSVLYGVLSRGEKRSAA